jgi:hypothetical protein
MRLIDRFADKWDRYFSATANYNSIYYNDWQLTLVWKRWAFRVKQIMVPNGDFIPIPCFDLPSCPLGYLPPGFLNAFFAGHRRADDNNLMHRAPPLRSACSATAAGTAGK